MQLRVHAHAAQLRVEDERVTAEVTVPYRVRLSGTLPLLVEAKRTLFRYEDVLALAPGLPLVIESVAGRQATVFVLSPMLQRNRFQVDCASLRAWREGAHPDAFRTETLEQQMHRGSAIPRTDSTSVVELRVHGQAAGENAMPFVLLAGGEGPLPETGWRRLQNGRNGQWDVDGWTRVPHTPYGLGEGGFWGRASRAPGAWTLAEIPAGTRLCAGTERGSGCGGFVETTHPVAAIVVPLGHGRCRLFRTRTLLHSGHDLFFPCDRADLDSIRLEAVGLEVRREACEQGECYRVTRELPWSFAPFCGRMLGGLFVFPPDSPASDAFILLGSDGWIEFIRPNGTAGFARRDDSCAPTD